MAEALFIDTFTGGKFLADEEKVRESFEKLNKKLLDNKHISYYEIAEKINKHLPASMKLNTYSKWPIGWKLKKDTQDKPLKYEAFTFSTEIYKDKWIKSLPIILINYDMQNVHFEAV